MYYSQSMNLDIADPLNVPPAPRLTFSEMSQELLIVHKLNSHIYVPLRMNCNNFGDFFWLLLLRHHQVTL